MTTRSTPVNAVRTSDVITTSTQPQRIPEALSQIISKHAKSTDSVNQLINSYNSQSSVQ